jgi:hypothetical protein
VNSARGTRKREINFIEPACFPALWYPGEGFVSIPRRSEYAKTWGNLSKGGSAVMHRPSGAGVIELRELEAA